MDVCSDVAEIMSRIVRYLSGANHILPLPLSEVILTNKDKGYHVTSTFFILNIVLKPVLLHTVRRRCGTSETLSTHCTDSVLHTF